MFLFPLINFIFLVILYVIHKRVFWVTFAIESILYVIGIWYIETNFWRIDNQLLYYFTLTGIGFVIVFIAFFIAIFLNQKHLYTDIKTPE